MESIQDKVKRLAAKEIADKAKKFREENPDQFEFLANTQNIESAENEILLNALSKKPLDLEDYKISPKFPTKNIPDNVLDLMRQLRGEYPAFDNFIAALDYENARNKPKISENEKEQKSVLSHFVEAIKERLENEKMGEGELEKIIEDKKAAFRKDYIDSQKKGDFNGMITSLTNALYYENNNVKMVDILAHIAALNLMQKVSKAGGTYVNHYNVIRAIIAWYMKVDIDGNNLNVAKNKSLWICGTIGIGKTWFIQSILFALNIYEKRLVGELYSAESINYIDVKNDLNLSAKWLDKSKGFWVFDDVGAESKEFVDNVWVYNMPKIISMRSKKGSERAIYISNFRLDKNILAQKYDKDLDANGVIVPRNASRLMELYEMVIDSKGAIPDLRSV